MNRSLTLHLHRKALLCFLFFPCLHGFRLINIKETVKKAWNRNTSRDFLSGKWVESEPSTVLSEAQPQKLQNWI